MASIEANPPTAEPAHSEPSTETTMPPHVESAVPEPASEPGVSAAAAEPAESAALPAAEPEVKPSEGVEPVKEPQAVESPQKRASLFDKIRFPHNKPATTTDANEHAVAAAAEETTATPVKPKFNLFKKQTHVEENVAVEEKAAAEENVEATTGMPIEDSTAPAVSPVAGEKKKGVFGFGGFGKSGAAAVKEGDAAAVGSENVETGVVAPGAEEAGEAAVKEEKEVVGGGAEKEKKKFSFKNPFIKTNEPSSPVAETRVVAEESKVEGVKGGATNEAAAATGEVHEEIAATTVESETKEETNVEPSKKRFSFKIPSFQRSAGSTSSAPVTTEEKNAVAETEPVVETESVKETVVVAQDEVKENVVVAQEAAKEEQHATAAAEEKTTSPKAPLFAFKFPSFQKASGSASQSKDVSVEEVKPEAEASTEHATVASETKVNETTTAAAPPPAAETVTSPKKIASAFASLFSKPAATTALKNEEPESLESHEAVVAPVAGETETTTSPPAPSSKKGFARALSIPKLFVSSKHASPETVVEEQPAVEAKEASAGECEAPAAVVEKKAEGPTHKFVSGVKGLFAKKATSGASEVEVKGGEEVGEVKAVSTETRDVVEGAVEGKKEGAVVAGESVVKSEEGAGEIKADVCEGEGGVGVVVGAAAAEEGEKGVTAA
ncbi:hypothetical protein HDU98_007374 [Podochytrium sp. JEL0797]|nr:hypothetical protein HDU98_007374 [Podochytrium sp. JEL0797]